MFVYELIIYIFFETYIVNKDLHDEYIKKKNTVSNAIGIIYKKKSNNQKCWVYDQKNPNT